MTEEKKIEPYYQAQGKQLVDTLFDLGLLSESLSRDGINAIEDLVALHFQQIGESAARCAHFTKRYKQISGSPPGAASEVERHEEEKRWIARAKEAEMELAILRDNPVVRAILTPAVDLAIPQKALVRPWDKE